MNLYKRNFFINTIKDEWIHYLEISLIIILSFFPLFFDLPYRDNIYLSWEGAYRLYLGQIPYVDFGLPMGFGFWVIPAFFFKLFGPHLFTLIKAQVFINIISIMCFRNILSLLGMERSKVFLSVIVFILSYSFPNFWPWYNHTVFVFQLICLNLILIPIFRKTRWNSFLVVLGGFFAFFAFYTKQDSGAIAIMMGGALLLYDGLVKNNYKLFTIYGLSVLLFASIFIVPFLQFDFLYWFNYGQAPHDSRLELYDFLYNIFGGSAWEKFYILMIVVTILNHYNFKMVLIEEKQYIFLFITMGVILQALLVKVTSPLPTGHTSYFHAFAFAFLIANIRFNLNLHRLSNLAIILFLIGCWWSSIYWGYAERIFKLTPNSTVMSENPGLIQSNWITSDLKAFESIKMPPKTIQGIQNILNLDVVKNKKDLKVLNMSEVTPLAYEIGYEPEKGQPLWYHLNIGMFEKEVKLFSHDIENQYYDLALFQVIPDLDNFFPYAVRNELKKHYVLFDTFEAPRKRTEGYSYIEVYIKR